MKCGRGRSRLGVCFSLKLQFILTFLLLFFFCGWARVVLVRVAPEFFHRIQENKEQGVYDSEDAHS